MQCDLALKQKGNLDLDSTQREYYVKMKEVLGFFL